MKRPLAQLYRWEGEDSRQNIWDQSNVLLGQPFGYTLGTLGTHWELEGTCWEQRKSEKNPPPTLATQNLKEKKSRHFECVLQPTHWPHVFFVFKTVWSPYLASANGRGRNWTRKKNKKQISTHSWMLQFFSFWGATGRGIFFPPLFPMCSYHVPKWFPSSKCPHIKFPNRSQMRSGGCSQ
jgi:hypothetical protein